MQKRKVEDKQLLIKHKDKHYEKKIFPQLLTKIFVLYFEG